MIILGLTGSVGMGKSTTAHLLRRLRVPVHESDQVVHQLLGRGGAAVSVLRTLFPDAYDVPTKSMNRKKLGALVFGNPQKRQMLEAVLHPLVQQAQQKFITRMRGRKVVALDIPLLFETGAEARVHQVLVVTAPNFVQRQRVLKRFGMTDARFKSILALQIPDRYKRDMADIIIPTGLGRAYTTACLQKVLRHLKRGHL